MPTFKYEISSKLPNATTSIFTKMALLAHRENAINLSQGFPDFPISKELIDLVTEAMKKGYNQYAPMPGIRSLREGIANKVAALYAVSYHPETEITVTAGATQAIYTIISAFVKNGDEVIIFAPAYDCYDPAIKLNGGKTVEVELEAPHFKVDWHQVKASINDKTKMIIINTPHNPSGTVLSASDMKTLEALVRGTNIILISDEVYEHIIFDGLQHQSAVLFPELRNRSFVVASFGKTFHATGWKLGYCLAPAELMVEFRKTHQFNVFSVNHPVQKALAAYIENPETYLSLPGFYQARRDFFLDAIKGSRFSIVPSQGTYFQLLGYENISEENDVAFSERLTKAYKIASIPVSVFYNHKIDKKVLRFCFSKNEDTLLKAAEILNSI
ncbi:MAG: methionine aminotransferase [Flavobacteriaceae bacterium]|nr:methionine aminotransferase [Flavobacteriaceae bacterium]